MSDPQKGADQARERAQRAKKRAATARRRADELVAGKAATLDDAENALLAAEEREERAKDPRAWRISRLRMRTKNEPNGLAAAGHLADARAGAGARRQGA
jgi:hypothetical protein